MRVNRIYILATVVSVAILLTNQIFIQYWLDKKQDDSRVINKAGRQRMLSQQLLVHAYELRDNKQGATGRLNQTIREWNAGHEFLVGVQVSQVFSNEGKQLPSLLAEVEALMRNAEAKAQSSSTLDARSWEVLSQNQREYLDLMEKVVLLLQKESDRKLSFVIRMELVLAALSLLAIGYEIIFIFRKISTNLERQNEELRHSNELLEEYAFLASHDLRQPILTVVNFTQLLRRELKKGSMSEDTKEYLGYVEEAGRRMHKTTDLLLEVAEYNQRKATIIPVNPRAVIEQLKDELTGQAEYSKASIRAINMPDEILMDENILYLVLKNLVSNGLKFCSPDIAPEVTITYTRHRKKHEFAVKDNGIGIAEPDQNKIFRLFQRLHTPNEYPGTGMGLSIVLRLVKQAEGHLELESQPGIGSTFKVFFPIFE